jgi:hypothetical protein
MALYSHISFLMQPVNFPLPFFLITGAKVRVGTATSQPVPPGNSPHVCFCYILWHIMDSFISGFAGATIWIPELGSWSKKN